MIVKFPDNMNERERDAFNSAMVEITDAYVLEHGAPNRSTNCVRVIEFCDEDGFTQNIGIELHVGKEAYILPNLVYMDYGEAIQKVEWLIQEAKRIAAELCIPCYVDADVTALLEDEDEQVSGDAVPL